jgi:gas vesicle protein
LSREILFKKILKIPTEYSIDSYIAKERLINSGGLNSNDKKILKDYVRQIQWCYRFREDNIRIKPYLTDTHRYGEVEIINVILKDENISRSSSEDNTFIQDKKIERIVELLFRIITFPELIIVQYKSYIRLFVSHISVNLIDSKKRTIDEVISTNWIDAKNINDLEYTLFNNIQLENLSHENFYKFYDGFVESIIRYNGSITSGNEVNLSTDRIKEINDEISDLNKEIKKLRSQLKKETQPRLMSEINNEIRNRRLKIRDLENELKG